MSDKHTQSLLRRLYAVWADFEPRLNRVPVIDRLNRGRLRLEDYRELLYNHRQQVIDGGRWIALAAANIDNRYHELRSRFLRHAVTEHRDFLLLEQNYQAVGGNLEDIRNGEKNIGAEALSAWMFYRAGLPNPFDLLGAMFIIEGLGKHVAGRWADKIAEQLNLNEDQVSFYRYHGQHDDDHLNELEQALGEAGGVLAIPGMDNAIVKTAKVTARLYLLQLEELGNV